MTYLYAVCAPQLRIKSQGMVLGENSPLAPSQIALFGYGFDSVTHEHCGGNLHCDVNLCAGLRQIHTK